MALFKKKDDSQPKKEKVKKVTPKQASFDFVKASREFERSRIGDIEASRTLAWRVAFGACLVALMCAAAVMMLTPFKEVRPYVIRVDNSTGQTDIVTMLENAKSDYGEEVAKYFSAMYVSLVEGYDWYTIQTQVNRAMLFSDGNMQQQITNKFARADAPHKLYKDQKRINIKINNVTFISKSNLVQVRFSKSLEPMNGGTYNARDDVMNPAPIVTQHIATMGYEYVNVPSVDDVRLVNPLGFTVKTYRVDDISE